MAVYFARAGLDGLVKIGFAVSVQRRLAHLSSGCPFPLTLLRECEGSRQTEAWLHRHFADARRHGEWFEYRADMLAIQPPALVDSAVLAPVIVDAERRAAMLGISVADICRTIGVHRATWQRWKAGTGSPRGQMWAAVEARLQEAAA